MFRCRMWRQSLRSNGGSGTLMTGQTGGSGALMTGQTGGSGALVKRHWKIRATGRGTSHQRGRVVDYKSVELQYIHMLIDLIPFSTIATTMRQCQPLRQCHFLQQPL